MNATTQGLADARPYAERLAGIERILAVDPRNVRGLVDRGDLYVEAGDARAASAFYRQALKVAPAPQNCPPDMLVALRRAEAALAAQAREYQDHLYGRLAAAGFDPAVSSQRFADSMEMLLGKKQVYYQQPKYFYFPGLPQRQFYPRDMFPWMPALEAATDDIRGELLRVLEEPDAFQPYVQGDPNRPRKDQQGMLNNPAWSALYLWKNGQRVDEYADRFPRTLEALREVPLAQTPNRSPSVLFSLLKPGAAIPPHNGLTNTRLICHLPLITPAGCYFRVGNETREWEQGKAWAFDDSMDHEARNTSRETRVILLFDIRRPELTDEENRLVGELFSAIDAHAGAPPQWEI